MSVPKKVFFYVLCVFRYILSLKNEFPKTKVGWEKAEKLHLTLKFLGETNEVQIEKLSEIVSEISAQFSNLKFELSETGVFPSQQNTRVLWLGVNGDIELLQNINSILETECEKIGFKKETRIFKPHLTIARIREPQKSKYLIQKHLENIFAPVAFEVSEIVIYESRLHPTGSIYSKVFCAALKS